MAQDKGFPPLSRSVEVQIDVVDRANNPPVWDHVVYGPIYIRENLPVGAKVVSVKARFVVDYCWARATHAAPALHAARCAAASWTRTALPIPSSRAEVRSRGSQARDTVCWVQLTPHRTALTLVIFWQIT